MSDAPPPDWRMQQVAEAAAEKALAGFAKLYGMEDVSQTRINLHWLDTTRRQAESRQNEGRKTVFTVIGGLVLLVLGYMASAIGLKGHAP